MHYAASEQKKDRTMTRWLVRALIGMTLLAAVSPTAWVQAQTPAAASPLRVVASFSILGDLVTQVGGDAVQVTTLIGPGVDAHTFDPAPADLVALEDADVIFEIGLGFEPWLDRFFASTQPAGMRIVASEGVTPRQAGANEVAAGDQAGTDEQRPGAVDPHIWGNVANAIVMVNTIRDALMAADPAHAATYRANAAAYTKRLQALDTWIRQQVAMLPADRRKLVTSHDTLGYFADAYGFQIIGTALGSLSTEVGDPSAQEIVALIGQIEDAGVPAIFAETVSNPDLMASIAAEAGVTLAPTLYTDALGPPGSPGATYEEMMRSNVTTIVDALKG
jgi:zinc/manganese transport system substrate-binding protein